MRRILPQHAVLHTVKSIEHIALVTLGIPGITEFGYGISPWGLFPWGAPTVLYTNQLFRIWYTNYPRVTTPEGVMTFIFPYRTYPDHPALPRNSRYWLFDTTAPQGIDFPQISHIGQTCSTMVTASTTCPTLTTTRHGQIVVSFLISASALCTKHRTAMRASVAGGYGQIPYGMDVYGSVTQTYQIG